MSISFVCLGCFHKQQSGRLQQKCFWLHRVTYALLATPNIKGYEIDFQNVNFISKDRYDESPDIKIRLGDVLLAKDGSTLGTTNIVRKLPIEATVNSSLAVITPKINLNSSFLYFYLKSQFVDSNIQLLKGGMGVPHLFQSDLNRFIFPLPPIDQQKIIAKKLDSETTRIDTLIAKKTRFIELLKEKRQTLITQSVTKGLNPNVKMKYSGVEWLGEVPEHWEIFSVKDISQFLTSGPRGWSEHITEDGTLFIQSGDLTNSLGIDFGTAKRVKVGNDAEAIRTRLSNGDVVVCITGAKTGNVAICTELRETAHINQHLCLIRTNKYLMSKYLAITLKSDIGQTQFEVAQSGLKQGLSLHSIREVLIAAPPFQEQKDILDYLTDVITRIESLISKTDHSITLLKERRSALITAAVTGQIDLREAA